MYWSSRLQTRPSYSMLAGGSKLRTQPSLQTKWTENIFTSVEVNHFEQQPRQLATLPSLWQHRLSIEPYRGTHPELWCFHANLSFRSDNVGPFFSGRKYCSHASGMNFICRAHHTFARRVKIRAAASMNTIVLPLMSVSIYSTTCIVCWCCTRCRPSEPLPCAPANAACIPAASAAAAMTLPWLPPALCTYGRLSLKWARLA